MMKSIAASLTAVSYALALFYLSFCQAGTLRLFYKRAGISSDNLLHLLSFALLAFLIRRMFSTRLYQTVIQNPLAWSAGVSVVLSLILEILQMGISTRHASFLDLLLHCGGIFIYFTLDRLFQSRPTA